MRNFRKLISVILTVMMIMSVLPVGAAGTGSSSGSAGGSAGGAGGGANIGGSSTPASPYPAGAIGLFYEDFESGYTVGENWFETAEQTAAWTDILKYKTADGKWDIQSNLRSQTANTNDSISVEDVSGLNLGGNFSGKALKLYNDRATAYGSNYFAFRRNFNGTEGISLTSGSYAGKKLVYEVDLRIANNNLGSYTADKQEMFLLPSRQEQIYDYPNSGQWKGALRYGGGLYRMELGSSLPNMGYHSAQINNVVNNVGHFKFVLDQTADVDVMNIWYNGQQFTQPFAPNKNNPYSGMTTGDFYPTGYNNTQPFDFGATVLGLWASVNGMEYYIDNLKAYLVNEFTLAMDARHDSFNPAHTVIFAMTNEIDPSTATVDALELRDTLGNVIPNGIESVTLGRTFGKYDSLVVKVSPDAVEPLTSYEIYLKEGVLKDIYGFSVETDYNLKDGYYVPEIRSTRCASITTCQMLALDGTTPTTVENYIQGENQEIILTFNDYLNITDADLADAFEVTDANGDPVSGTLNPVFGATRDEVKLQLSGLVLGRGNHTIKSKANALYNRAGTYADVEYTFGTLDFNAVATETEIGYVPTTNKEITVNLTVPTALTNENIATGFVAKDAEGNVVDGLGVTLDNTGKVVTLQLSGLEVTSGTYTIDVTDALVDGTGRTAMLDAVIEIEILEFEAKADAQNGFYFKPGESKAVNVSLSVPTVLTASDVATAFALTDANGRAVRGLGVTLVNPYEIKLTLDDIAVDEGVYYIKSTDALKDEADRNPVAPIELMFNVAKKTMLFSEDFENYTLNEEWISNANKVSEGKYKVANGAWDITSSATTDSAKVVSAEGLGGNFSGNALRLYNDAATSYSSGHFSIRRNFNGTEGISLTSGEYAGKKLVYEADFLYKKANGAYTSDYQSSFFLVSRKDTIHDYSDNQWKLTFQSGGTIRVEEGTWANASRGARMMWYNTPYGAHNYSTEAGKIKVILDQTGVVDSITVESNGTVMTSTAPSVLDGHARNGFETTAIMPAGYQGQAFNFADIVYGIWGSPSDAEIYMDNFQAYLIDAFTVESVAVDGNASAYEASTDSIVYTFSGEVDPASIQNAIDVYDAEGNKVGTAVKSVALEGGNKVLRVTLAKSLAGESAYKVVLNDKIRDIYGSGIANDYVWYDYPINDYYTLTNGAFTLGSVNCTYTKVGNSPAKVAANGNYETYVDCYIQKPSTANREVEFTTSRKIVVEGVSPAAIPGYDLGKDQTITIKLAEALNPAINLAEAFTVTDEDGKNITGLQATFGDTTDTIVLQLSGLALGNGKHFIESVDGKLANAEGIFANVSVSVSTVDYMVTYAEPGTGVLVEYKEGADQTVVFGLSSSSAITGDVSSHFEVVDEDGVAVDGIVATYNSNNASRSDDDTISLQLSGLALGRGKHTIKVKDTLVDRRGRSLTYEYTFIKLPFKATYESAVSDYEPKTDREIVINLTYELSDAAIANLNNAFVVENEEGLKVSGLTATASEDKLAIKLQLKDLDISGGVYKITSKSGVITSVTNEALAVITITVDTGSDAAFGPSVGEGAGSGAPIDPNADFSTVVLLDENFENSIEKAEKGIEFIPSVNWYTSPDKIPSIFTLEKVGAEYRDANISVVPDPADPSNGNMVLKYYTGVYGKDGSILGSPQSTSNGKNYTVVKRAMDNTIQLPKDKYTEVRMSTKFYVPDTTLSALPLSGQQLRNSQYLIAGTSNAGKTINSTNFAKDSGTGNPKFHMYVSGATATNTGMTGGVDSTFTTNEWHTMEYVFSVHEYVKDGNSMKGGFQVYVDGVAVKDGIAFLSEDYDTLNGMMARLVANDSGAAITVYYDDWKITKSTKYTTHVDTPATNVPENQDITLTLTKALDNASVALINESLANDNVEDLVVVKDAKGNVVDAKITVATAGDVITIEPTNGLKYNTEYIVEVKPSVKVNGVAQYLKAADGEEYKGISYPFATAKAKDTYIDAEAGAASFAVSTANGATQDMGEATRFAYTMNLSGAHTTDVIAAVAAFTEKEELIGIQYQTIVLGGTSANFDFNTFAGKTGAKTVRMYIWERIPDGFGGYKMGRLMQLPDEITSR